MAWQRVGELWVKRRFSIEVVGENASGKPTRWGVKENGLPCMSGGSVHYPPSQRTFDRLNMAKRWVDLKLIAETFGGA